MVLDGGGRFIPAGIDGFHTLSLLLASLVAHDRATYTCRKETQVHEKKTSENTRWVQKVILNRDVLTPPPCE